MPVLILTGQESTDPSKAQVGPVAAALPDAHRLALARQQHIANILDPETFTKHLLGFLHGPTLHCEPDTIVEVEPLVTGPSPSTICMSAGPSPFPVYAHTRTSVHRQP
jgi:hypothetical protein